MIVAAEAKVAAVMELMGVTIFREVTAGCHIIRH